MCLFLFNLAHINFYKYIEDINLNICMSSGDNVEILESH